MLDSDGVLSQGKEDAMDIVQVGAVGTKSKQLFGELEGR